MIALDCEFATMKIDFNLDLKSLATDLTQFWDLATQKALQIERQYDVSQGSPVFTQNGKYTTKGWTEWTQGFQFGIPLLIFDATGDTDLLQIGRSNTISKMAHHISHFGVHDHGFNNLSTYGSLLRMANQNKFEASPGEIEFYRLAIKMSGAVQAKRWSNVNQGGYIYSFNGPHSLFIDTIRTCRILLVAHQLGHRMLDENDLEVDLLDRAITHGLTTARYAVYYGEGRDRYDVWGRVAHESIFNLNDGNYRSPNAQQGFSGYTTWTRGLAWAMLGFSEFLEFLDHHDQSAESNAKSVFLKAARATCDFYIEHTSLDGIPYWDTGAPELHKLGQYQESPANPFNDYEPVDSSAAAIGAQGLLRLANILKKSDVEVSAKYYQAGITVLKTLLAKPYLATDPEHQGILLHTIYHQPNGWDFVPAQGKIPYGESCMWGDYHLVELCLLAQRLNEGKYYSFYQSTNA